jgi:hypothetical protein
MPGAEAKRRCSLMMTEASTPSPDDVVIDMSGEIPTTESHNPLYVGPDEAAASSTQRWPHGLLSVAVVCACVLVSSVPSVLVLLGIGVGGFGQADTDANGGAQVLYPDGREPTVAPVNYFVNASGCMTDEELRDATLFVVDLQGTLGVTYGLRADSVLRVPVTNTSCGRALLVRAADPDVDVLVIDTDAVLIKKEETQSMLDYIMGPGTAGDGRRRLGVSSSSEFDRLVAVAVARNVGIGSAVRACGLHWKAKPPDIT